MNFFSQRAIRLVIASLLFFGWMSYLGYAALNKNRNPIISRIQLSAASLAIVADVTANNEGKALPRVKVVESLLPDGPAIGSELIVLNLSEAQGFSGSGAYLLLLQRDVESPSYKVIGFQPSPGHDHSGANKPMIYPWTDDVRREFEWLRQ